jgi:beta-glucanase (GH16 family)
LLITLSQTYGWWTERRTSYDQDFHTYVLEWTAEWMRVYVDTRLHHMLDLRFNEPFFKRGNFPAVVTNGTDQIVLKNPWETNATVVNAAPFDQNFYLVMNVAVGGTNGWFPDNAGDKPWLDGSLSEFHAFAPCKAGLRLMRCL